MTVHKKRKILKEEKKKWGEGKKKEKTREAICPLHRARESQLGYVNETINN